MKLSRGSASSRRMADFEFTRTLNDVYAKSSPGSYGHLQPTKYRQPTYSVPAIPFDWLLRKSARMSRREERNWSR